MKNILPENTSVNFRNTDFVRASGLAFYFVQRSFSNLQIVVYFLLQQVSLKSHEQRIDSNGNRFISFKFLIPSNLQ